MFKSYDDVWFLLHLQAENLSWSRHAFIPKVKKVLAVRILLLFMILIHEALEKNCITTVLWVNCLLKSSPGRTMK